MLLTFSNEKVEQRQRDGVSREHVVTAGADAAHGHAGAAPDVVGLLQPPAPHRQVVGRRVRARLALEVRPRHRQRCDQHRETPQQEHCAG